MMHKEASTYKSSSTSTEFVQHTPLDGSEPLTASNTYATKHEANKDFDSTQDVAPRVVTGTMNKVAQDGTGQEPVSHQWGEATYQVGDGPVHAVTTGQTPHQARAAASGLQDDPARRHSTDPTRTAPANSTIPSPQMPDQARPAASTVQDKPPQTLTTEHGRRTTPAGSAIPPSIYGGGIEKSVASKAPQSIPTRDRRTGVQKGSATLHDRSQQSPQDARFKTIAVQVVTIVATFSLIWLMIFRELPSISYIAAFAALAVLALVGLNYHAQSDRPHLH